jgi:hypothetical protein
VKHLQQTPELLQIPKLLAHTLKHGTLTINTNGQENVQLQIENQQLNLNFQQKEQLKALLELQAETEQSIRQKLRKLKTAAEQLKQNQLTITISYKNQKLITLGQNAKPTISQIITDSDAIEVHNLLELVRLTR